MIYFAGTSHAAKTLREAAFVKGLSLTEKPGEASLIFISQDTPTSPDGVRNLKPIIGLIEWCRQFDATLVLTSQVPPGFTRSLGIHNIFHQAETLRIKDALDRALNPEYIAVGGEAEIPAIYAWYLIAFGCPVLRMSWEEAELSKIAINTFLAAQVDTTNRLAKAAEKVGANWNMVKLALQHDKRIGQHAYLEPGCWQNSQHLLRDAVTLEGL